MNLILSECTDVESEDNKFDKNHTFVKLSIIIN